LATILQRLQSVEQKCTTLGQWQPSQDSPSSSSIEQRIVATTDTLSNGASPATSLSATPFTAANVEIAWNCDAPPINKHFDAAALFEKSLGQVEVLVRRRCAKAVITDNVYIPKELAKTWVDAFFKLKPQDMFLSFVDRRLIDFMPDLVEMDHVHVDPAIMVVYYTILVQGCALVAATTSPSDMQYYNAAYISCIRAIPSWQQEASGTMIDLVAATSMVMVCTSFFNFGLLWQMYACACEYVKRLDIANLDAKALSPNGGRVLTDAERKGFWELVQIDLVMQLMHDKPPSITATTWRVNMPWLDPDSMPNNSGNTTEYFLASSRMSLTLMKFNSILEEKPPNDYQAALVKTETLCDEMKDIYRESHLGKWTLGSDESMDDQWRVVDTILVGHVGIIFMLRKVIKLSLESPTAWQIAQKLASLPTAVDAARNILETSAWALNKCPWTESISQLLGAFQIHVPYVVLLNAILEAPDKQAHVADIKMLQDLGGAFRRVASTEKEYWPLMKAMETILLELGKI
jgi:hypothetical protein